MSAGKLASQAVHAGRLCLLKFMQKYPHRIQEFIDCNTAGSVVVLRAKNASVFDKLSAKVEEAGLISVRFEDSGHVMLPHFDGSPTLTAMAIGPARKEDIFRITSDKKLKLRLAP